MKIRGARFTERRRPIIRTAMKIVKEELTPDQLRKFPGFSHLTDEEAEILTEQVKEIAFAIFEFQMKRLPDEQTKKAA